MASKTWVGKQPADMSDSELREAKSALTEQIAPAQERLNTLSAAVGQVNREINERFLMAEGLQPASSLPAYPLDAINTEFGG